MPRPSSTGNVETLNALSLETYRARLLGDDADLTSTLKHLTELPTKDDPAPSQLQLRLNFDSAASLSHAELEACLRLIKTSSMADYKNSSIRWSEADKRREMRLPDMRYLLVRGDADHGTKDDTGGETGGDHQNDSDSKDGEQDDTITAANDDDNDNNHDDTSQIRGFVSFMVTYEDGFEVVYIYEIHMAESLRGKGVGARLMGLVEEAAQRAGVAKTMLTVFVSNGGARRFYERLGYGLDEFSPRPRKLRNGVTREPDYHILSKPVVVVAAAAAAAAAAAGGTETRNKKPRLEKSPSLMGHEKGQTEG